MEYAETLLFTISPSVISLVIGPGCQLLVDFAPFSMLPSLIPLLFCPHYYITECQCSSLDTNLEIQLFVSFSL